MKLNKQEMTGGTKITLCFPTRCANRWGYLKIKKSDSHPHAHVGNG